MPKTFFSRWRVAVDGSSALRQSFALSPSHNLRAHPASPASAALLQIWATPMTPSSTLRTTASPAWVRSAMGAATPGHGCAGAGRHALILFLLVSEHSSLGDYSRPV